VYEKGLNFLVETQNESGCWNTRYGNNPGVVGLAVMAFLAHGEDPNYGTNKDPICSALDYILKSQQDSGYLGNSMYNHGFATLALAEAYGRVHDKRLGPALNKAVQLLLKSQKNNPHWAWRYSPNDQTADTTVSGACLVALFAARNAGVEVPDKSIKQALLYYKNCQGHDGGIGYTNRGSGSEPRNAIGALVFALGNKMQTKQFKSVFTKVKGGHGHVSHAYYNMYYKAQALFQGSPKDWERWNRQQLKRLQNTQTSNGSWSGQYGATFSTAAALLSLALNYRYLPIYER
jgi:hypothetical protein